MDITNWSDEDKRKSNSPFSIFFYLKKTNGDEEKAKQLYNEFLEKKSPFRNPKNRTTSIEYWLARGFSKEEAEIKLSERQSNPLDKKAYCQKYGESDGIARYNQRKENLQNRVLTEIANIKSALNCDDEAAYDVLCQRKRACSPRTLDYWLERGYSLDEAKSKRSRFQQEQSPRSIWYWLTRGYSYEDAKEKNRLYQDNLSIPAIKRRYGCTDIVALDIQESVYKRMVSSQIENGNAVPKHNSYEFYVYRTQVDYFTKRTLKLYKDQFVKKPGTTLDHKYSKLQGFIDGIPAEVIGSVVNLEYIDKSHNAAKQAMCSITPHQLFTEYSKWKSSLT